jgi:hypothetical protein
MAVTLLIVVVVLVAFGISALRGRRNSAEKQLARMLSPDAAQRLIDYEMKREPGLSRSKAAAKALDRAMYDRGR